MCLSRSDPARLAECRTACPDQDLHRCEVLGVSCLKMVGLGQGQVALQPKTKKTTKWPVNEWDVCGLKWSHSLFGIKAMKAISNSKVHLQQATVPQGRQRPCRGLFSIFAID